MKPRPRSKLQYTIAIAAATGVFALAGCAAGQSGVEGPSLDEFADLTKVDSNTEVLMELPKVMTDEEGASFQRTPSDDVGDTNPYTDLLPYEYEEYQNNYNIRFLNADNRGCSSCHDDLAQLLEDMDYDHVPLTNQYGIDQIVQMCKNCHTTPNGYIRETKNLGNLMHTIHANERSANCWSCHYSSEDGKGIQLWDDIKYEQLRGITPLESVEGNFSFTQDSTRHRADGDNLYTYLHSRWLPIPFNFGPMPGNPNINGFKLNELSLDQELFDEWTITVAGPGVDRETTWTLPELIEKAPNEDVILKMSCEINPIGGPLISNCNVRGIPLSWLLEQAGVHDDAYGFTAAPAAQGENGSLASAAPVQLFGNEDDEAYLIYELDGTPLQWSEGYPAAIWLGGYSSAGACVKQISDIVVYDETGYKEIMNLWGSGFNGWVADEETVFEGTLNSETEQQGWYLNKPNVGIFNNREGRILKAGEPYTFEGYADSYNNEITAVEFSLDGGTTWTTYETEGATDDRWVNWKLEYTPDTEGAYVLSIRAKNINGLITPEPIQLMFNVREF